MYWLEWGTYTLDRDPDVPAAHPSLHLRGGTICGTGVPLTFDNAALATSWLSNSINANPAPCKDFGACHHLNNEQEASVFWNCTTARQHQHLHIGFLF